MKVTDISRDNKEKHTGRYKICLQVETGTQIESSGMGTRER